MMRHVQQRGDARRCNKLSFPCDLDFIVVMFVVQIEPFAVSVHVIGATAYTQTHRAYCVGKLRGNAHVYGAYLGAFQFIDCV